MLAYHVGNLNPTPNHGIDLIQITLGAADKMRAHHIDDSLLIVTPLRKGSAGSKPEQCCCRP